MLSNFVIICDSREQSAFEFDNPKLYKNAAVKVAGLKTGDYSIEGMEHLAAVERKSMPDFLGSISTSRERFERELERSLELDAFMVVIEEPFRNLGSKEYVSHMNRNAAVQTVLSWMSKYRCTWFFAESRDGAEFATYHFLRHYYKRHKNEIPAYVGVE